MNTNTHSFEIGWREWLVLPELKVPGIKAKIDTGARTSALHALLLNPLSMMVSRWFVLECIPYKKEWM